MGALHKRSVGGDAHVATAGQGTTLLIVDCRRPVWTTQVGDVLDGFCEVRGADIGPGEVSDRPADLPDAIVRGGGESQACDRGAYERVARFADTAELPDLARVQQAVCAARTQASPLYIAGSHDAFADRVGTLPGIHLRNDAPRDGRHFHLDVGALDYRRRNSLQVPLRGHGAARAAPANVTRPAARARVHRGYEQEACGVRDGLRPAHEMDLSLLNQPVKRIEHGPSELGEFVEEKDAVVGE